VPVKDGEPAATRLDAVFRDEWPRLVAATVRIVGDLQTAEDVVQDVLVSALDRWPLTQVPDNPGAWLMTACRNRAVNLVRDSGRAQRRIVGLVPLLGSDGEEPAPAIPDDRLRLVFICCHPVLAPDARVALTLRMLGGLSTSDIARAWHTPEATMAQRIVRAKRVLAERKVPFEEPTGADLANRLPAVLDVVYLIFNEGYLAGSGDQLTRAPLAVEAHRLARLLTDLLPGQSEPWALRALIAFNRSRDAARADDRGELVTLEYQDRSRWDRALIAEGVDALAAADKHQPPVPGPLLLQARVAACHATAASFADTDWPAVVAGYDQLLTRTANPVVALNRAVAVAHASGPDHALPLLDELVRNQSLARTHRVWAVRADLRRRSGDRTGAVADYDQALVLVDNDIERRHLTAARETTHTNTREESA
jgi:RNA polymerase sigma factor (sigma-70 family)